MPLTTGARLGRYEIVGPLGAGGMGEAYRAGDTSLQREVALKILPAGVATDPARLRRFEQESRAAAALNHPNIVAVHDIGAHDGAPYIVFELAMPLPLRRAIDYAAQIARGLAAALGATIDIGVPVPLFLTRIQPQGRSGGRTCTSTTSRRTASVSSSTVWSRRPAHRQSRWC
jgi:serine/threonine protein kinase